MHERPRKYFSLVIQLILSIYHLWVCWTFWTLLFLEGSKKLNTVCDGADDSHSIYCWLSFIPRALNAWLSLWWRRLFKEALILKDMVSILLFALYLRLSQNSWQSTTHRLGELTLGFKSWFCTSKQLNLCANFDFLP